MKDMKKARVTTDRKWIKQKKCELKDRNSQIIQSAENKVKRMKKSEERLCDYK